MIYTNLKKKSGPGSSLGSGKLRISPAAQVSRICSAFLMKRPLALSRHYHLKFALPQSTGVEPTINVDPLEAGAGAVFAEAAPQLVFSWETRRPLLPEPINLPAGEARQRGKFVSSDEV